MKALRLRHNRNEKLIQFLYILLRDYVSAGDVENIIQNHLKETDERGWTDFESPAFTEYVITVARRLGMNNLIMTQEVEIDLPST